MRTDTIAAVATAMSESGIGIVRISGPEALSVGDKIYRTKGGKRRLAEFASHTIHYGFIVDPAGECEAGDWENGVIDEVMAAVMKAPNSYTMEDTVEINCHGGVLLMRRVLEAALKAGARLAEPGEFTKRAFLNGRIDLSRAEAVMDVIQARSGLALSSSIKQLNGAVSREIKALREEILYEIAFIESALDDPEHISLDGYGEELKDKTEGLSQSIAKLIASSDNGRIIKEGIQTVIVGKPNAGKSSLLNVLVGEERAIVTNVPGTTRDILQESVVLDGISLNIVDTAGIRSTRDSVEKIGVERARKYAMEADLILYVADASRPLDEGDRDIFKMIGDKKIIVLMNKIDLTAEVDENDFYEISGRSDIPVIRTSMKDNTGICEFEETVKKLFFHGELQENRELLITSLRHKEALQEAYESIEMVKKSIEDGLPEDFYSIDLMSAYASLGFIIGEEVGEDLVNEIFSKFCMGK